MHPLRRATRSFDDASLSKSDILVVYGSFDTGTWKEVDEDAFHFMPGDVDTGVHPSVEVRFFGGGRPLFNRSTFF